MTWLTRERATHAARRATGEAGMSVCLQLTRKKLQPPMQSVLGICYALASN